MSLQPSEFAKFATALALLNTLSQLDVSIKDVTFFIAGGII
jgi:cell division protein FtsW (lipid II flippase)